VFWEVGTNFSLRFITPQVRIRDVFLVTQTALKIKWKNVIVAFNRVHGTVYAIQYGKLSAKESRKENKKE
jgi:hypothetical protein